MPIFDEFVAYHADIDGYFEKVPGHGTMFASWLESQLDTPDARVLVAEARAEAGCRKQVVGYGLGRVQEHAPLYPEPRYGFVDNIGVAEPWQRRGVGAQLFEALRQWFQEQGVRRVELFAALGNPKSTRFWRKMGCTPFMEQMYMKL